MTEKRAEESTTGKLTLLPKGLLLALEPATGDESSRYESVHILRPAAGSILRSPTPAQRSIGEEGRARGESLSAARPTTDETPVTDSLGASTNVSPATFVSDSAVAEGADRNVAVLLGGRMPARQAKIFHVSETAPPELQLNAPSPRVFDDLQPPRQSSAKPTGHKAAAKRLRQYFDAPAIAQAGPSDFVLPDLDEDSAPTSLQSVPAAQSDSFDVTEPTDSSLRGFDPYAAPTNPLPSATGQYDELFNESATSDQPRTLDDDMTEEVEGVVKPQLEADIELDLKRLENENATDIDKSLEEDIEKLQLDDIQILPPEDDEAPPQRDEVEAPATDGDDEKPACDRVYDDRDCCAEEAECQRIFDFIRDNTLDKLSLNISPAFAPNAADAEEALRLQAEKLAEAPARTWENRQGEVLTTGRLEGFRHGKIQVRSDSGSITDIPIRDLDGDDFCFVNAWWGLPPECRLGDEPLEIRDWTMTTFTWTASAVCHKPLYFEHVELERYGHSGGPFIQPVMSAAHFFGNVLVLPYNMGLHPPSECIYGLGHYRPGSCAPWLIPGVPLHPRAALYQTGAVFGLIGILN